MESLTKEALECGFSKLFLLMERRYVDYLTGNLSHNVTPELNTETQKSCKNKYDRRK